MRDFKQLKVWQKAHNLTLGLYKATWKFPKEELYGLTSQIRRSAASIPANIAEGCGRSSEVELVRFLQIAGGSASELEYHLLLAKDLRLLNIEDYDFLNWSVCEVKKMLTGLIQTLKADR
ncbi:MAG: four helix bundle protein [Acidobacteriia bacterium]|nr:four helix bundle protein [Terriglobia bacterium]